jgi:hypothetical protein
LLQNRTKFTFQLAFIRVEPTGYIDAVAEVIVPDDRDPATNQLLRQTPLTRKRLFLI